MPSENQPTKPPSHRPAQEVVAFEPEGVLFFDNVNDAAAHYQLSPKRIYDCIRTGDCTYNGVSFNYAK